MTAGDRALIYHSGAEKAVVGTAAIARAAKPDGTDGWVSVLVEPLAPLAHAVTLAAMKAAPALAEMTMLRQARLSVSPVSPAEWEAVLALGQA